MFNKIKWLALAVMFLSVAACGSPKGTSITSSDPSKVLATIDGVAITEKEVMENIKPQMKKIEAELYKIKRAGVDQIINEKLLEQAAAKEGKNADQYLKEYLEKSIKEPTEDEIKKYYEFRKKQMGDKKYDEVKSAIADFLKSNQENAVRRKLINELRAAANIEIKIEPPRVEVEIGDSPSVGPKSAPVTLVEFTDFQCPFCSRAQPTIQKIMEVYPNKVRHVFKDFPLNFHKDAQKAHEAAHCAADQGKFWEIKKVFFSNQGALTVDDLKKYAKAEGLDMTKFNKCLDEGKHAEKVAKGIAEGGAAGVTGTPAFFINGISISGARPFTDFKEVIDSELSRKK